MEIKDTVKIYDKWNFIYNVIIKHYPVTGISIAYYDDQIIASRQYGRMLPPISDNDREWEEWEERFIEWAEAAILDLQYDCTQHFNNKFRG